MVMVGDGNVIVEVLVEIRLAVLVEIVQARNLITPQYIHLAFNNFQAEWLKEAGGVPAPFQFLKFLIDAANNPHVPRDRTHRRCCAVFKKIKSTTTNPGFPRVVFRYSDGIDHISPRNEAKAPPGGDWFVPLGWPALRHISQRAGFDFYFRKILELAELPCRTIPHAHDELAGRQK